MTRMRERAAAVVAVLGLTLMVAGVGSAADSKDVRVINLPTESLPVAVQGTPQVAATQAGAWTVGISGTPSVAIDPSANTVQVASSPGDPIAVQEVGDEPAFEPFLEVENVSIEDGAFSVGTTLDVPAGKILVIEQLHASFSLPGGQKPNSVRLLPSVGGSSGAFRFVAEPAGDSNLWNIEEQVTIYHGEGPMAIRGNRFPYNTGTGTFEWSVAGHLIDA